MRLTGGPPSRQQLRAKWGWLKGQQAYWHRPATVLTRLGLWWLRCQLGLPATVSLQPWGVRLWLPPQWRGVAKLIFAFREYYEPELKLLAQWLSPGAVFVDVGAAFGIYALVGAKLVGPEGTVLAFEPAAATFEVLERNLRLNGAANVRAFRVALADFRGETPLRHEADPSRNALAPTGAPYAGETVRVCRLDDVVSGLGLRRLDAVKLDVEGSEELVLAGAVRALKAWRPVVIFEVNPGAAARLGLRPEGAWGRLAALGYRFHRFDWSAGRLEALGAFPGGGNVVALPE